MPEPPAPSSTARRRFFFWLGVIVVVAGAWRVTYVITVAQNDHHLYDAAYYDLQARRLAQGKGFTNPFPFVAHPGPAADHPPLTALVLTPAAWLGGADVQLHMRYTMLLLGCAVVLLTGLLGRAVGGERVGLVAAAVAAVSPAFWMNDGLLMSETLATLTGAAAVLLAYRLVRRPRLAVAVGLGLVCGLAMLARAELALLLPMLALPAALLARKSSRRRRAVLAGVAVIAALVPVAPWVGYNLSRFREPTFISTGEGNVLRGANCRQTYYGSALGYWSLPCVIAALPVDPRAHIVLNNGEQSVLSRRLRDQGLRYARAHVGRLPVVATARAGRLWSVYAISGTIGAQTREGRPRWASWLGVGFLYATVVAVIGGIVAGGRRRLIIWPLIVPIVMVTLLAVVFYGIPRFRAPAEPSLAALAAVALASLGARRGRARLATGDEPAQVPSSTMVASSSS